MRHYTNIYARMNERDQDVVEVYDHKKKVLLFTILAENFYELFGMNADDLLEIDETKISVIIER